jgi:hypothetical protein
VGYSATLEGMTSKDFERAQLRLDIDEMIQKMEADDE